MIPEYNHSRPFNLDFYESLRLTSVSSEDEAARIRVPNDAGIAIDVQAGELIAFELMEGAQIVNLFAYNPRNPDERYWAHNTSSVEGAFLKRYSRLWGTMARFIPLLTILEDTVVTNPSVGNVSGKHHFAIGGWGTPADWSYGGGPPAVPTTWDRLTGALQDRGLPPTLLKDEACLFQKTLIDPRSQEQMILPSDAIAGDRISFFVEVDLVLVVGLSPYAEGGSLPSELDGSTRPVDFLSYGHVAEPLGWPYEGLAYPDLSLYLDDSGVRSDQSEPTAGRG